MHESVDFLVIGGGIIGLSLARAIRSEWPEAKVFVIEKEENSISHASGRNSGGLHAGFYYSPDTLKATLTREGNQSMREFCRSRGLELRETGKVVVASTPHQLAALDELYRRGQINGVTLEMIDEKRLAELEPLAKTIERALWSPNTAVANPKEVTAEIAKMAYTEGISVSYNESFIRYHDGILTTSLRSYKAKHFVNCAGLFADRVAKEFGHCDDYTMLPFTGLYAYAPNLKGTLRRHVYPVPDAQNPFLGVHATVTVDGSVKIGPTAIPAFSREAYRALRDLNIVDVIEIARVYPKFFSSEHHNVRRLITTEVPKYSRSWLVHEAQKLVPSLRRRDFTVKGAPGIRAQLFDLKNRKLEMDFVVRGDAASTHVLNAVSPAWTSSLPFAKHVVADISKRMQTFR